MFAPLAAALALAAANPELPLRPPPAGGLARALLSTVAAARLDELVDAGPEEGRCPGDSACPFPLPRVTAPPHLDLAVIRLDAEGRALEAANVQLDPSTPGGRLVALDRNLAATGVRFRRWDQARRESAVPAAFAGGSDDLAPSRAGAGPDFMAPYPASLFKLMVAFHVARRTAEGALRLDARVAEPPGPGAETHPVGEWLDRMIASSDNRATKALLRWLHARGEVDRMNRDLAALGLDTLRVDGTSRDDGGRWMPGEIHATAMDVARLLWLVEGGPRAGWRAPDGSRVGAAVLPGPGRDLLKRLLADQGLHEVLSTGSTCGAGPAGIPALVPERFLDPGTGVEAVGETTFGADVRPCNAAAEVRFLHKTGLTWNYAADAGIVESLPGKPERRYVVALLSSAGARFLDAGRAGAPRHPCDAEKVCVSRKLASIGAAVDAYVASAEAAPARPSTPDEQARFLAGLPQPDGSPLAPLASTPEWAAHAAALDADWAQLAPRLEQESAWAFGELAPRLRPGRKVVYFFGGPDAITAIRLFPDAPAYLLAGLEPVGGVAPPESLAPAEVGRALSQLVVALRTTVPASFFRTDEMGRDLRGDRIRGVTPILLLFLARDGARILEVRRFEIDAAGGAVRDRGDAEPFGPGIPGVRIAFQMPGRPEPQQMLYVRADLGNDALASTPGFLAWARGFGPSVALLKAASFILHDNRFSKPRDFLLEGSDAILQEDSGVPFRAFKKGRWDFTCFGRYTRPHRPFEKAYQADLDKACQELGSRPLPFVIGYRKPEDSNLLLAVKREGTTAK